MSDSKDFFTLGAAAIAGITGLITTGIAIKTKFDCEKALDEHKLTAERFADSTSKRFDTVDKALDDHDRSISSLSRSSRKHEKMLKKHSKNFEVLSKSQARTEREFRKRFKEDDRDIRALDRKLDKISDIYRTLRATQARAGKRTGNP